MVEKTEIEDNLFRQKSFMLIENDRDIPDFLELEHRDEIDLCCCEGMTKDVASRQLNKLN